MRSPPKLIQGALAKQQSLCGPKYAWSWCDVPDGEWNDPLRMDYAQAIKYRIIAIGWTAKAVFHDRGAA